MQIICTARFFHSLHMLTHMEPKETAVGRYNSCSSNDTLKYLMHPSIQLPKMTTKAV